MGKSYQNFRNDGLKKEYLEKKIDEFKIQCSRSRCTARCTYWNECHDKANAVIIDYKLLRQVKKRLE